jgi:hypothetical protein
LIKADRSAIAWRMASSMTRETQQLEAYVNSVQPHVIAMSALF